MSLKEMVEQRAAAIKRMREINDKAEAEKRSFSPEEQAEYTKAEADVEKLDDSIKAETERAERAARLVDLEQRQAAHGKPASKPEPADQRAAPKSDNPRASQEYQTAFRSYLEGETRADTLQANVFVKGGALVGPEQFVSELIAAKDNAVFVRRYARKFRLTSAMSLGAPTLDTDVADADWTTEILTGSQGDIETGKRELRPHPFAKLVKISKTLRRVSAIPVDALVRERLAYKFGVTEEKAFMTGTGNQQPLGIFTASANGISTSYDVSTDNTATTITADGLINAKHAMKAAYWPSARWVFHRDAIKMIRKMKDGNGQYLWAWAAGLTGGVQNTILDLPYDVSEYCPNTFTASLYVGALCSWPNYWVVDALDMTVQYLDQLYALTNQDGYVGRQEVDGAPVLGEAFIRVKTTA
jgi:HK97 family phage major capsid protein